MPKYTVDWVRRFYKCGIEIVEAENHEDALRKVEENRQAWLDNAVLQPEYGTYELNIEKIDESEE